MDKDEFMRGLANSSDEIDEKRMIKIIDKSIDFCSSPQYKFKGFMNLIIANEEFAECQQQVSKVLRGKMDRIELIEETADAFLSIKYIQRICDITDKQLNQAINVKLDRLSAYIGLNHQHKMKLSDICKTCAHKVLCAQTHSKAELDELVDECGAYARQSKGEEYTQQSKGE
jgi:hypothetical protein